MTAPQTIYSCADVARLLRVTRAAVTNYRTRFTDTPAPAFGTVDGREFWNVDGMRAWMLWNDARQSVTAPYQKRRAAVAEQAIDQLRDILS